MSRPPRLPDADVLALRDELRALHSRPITGLELRRELKRRHGTTGGVDRIYRLLGTPTPAPADVVSHLESQLAEARARTELAEHREASHQEHWALEVDRLRTELATLARLARRVPQLERELLTEARDRAAAERRIAQLEAALTAAGQALPDPIEHP